MVKSVCPVLKMEQSEYGVSQLVMALKSCSYWILEIAELCSMINTLIFSVVLLVLFQFTPELIQ